MAYFDFFGADAADDELFVAVIATVVVVVVEVVVVELVVFFLPVGVERAAFNLSGGTGCEMR